MKKLRESKLRESKRSWWLPDGTLTFSARRYARAWTSLGEQLCEALDSLGEPGWEPASYGQYDVCVHNANRSAHMTIPLAAVRAIIRGGLR